MLFQAVQRELRAAAAAAGAAGAAAGGRGRAPLLGRRAPRAPRAHEQAVRRDAGGLSAVSCARPRLPHCVTSVVNMIDIHSNGSCASYTYEEVCIQKLQV